MESVGPKDIISLKIEYFRELFSFIDIVMEFKSPKNVKEKTESILPELKEQTGEIRKESQYFFEKALSESVYKQSSYLLRYILKEIYDVDYTGISDHNIMTTSLDNDDFPPIFIDEDKNEPDFNKIFDCEERTLKNIGDFFEKFKSTYEFDSSAAIDFFEEALRKKNAFSSFESKLLWFPQYLNLLKNTYDNIFNDPDIYISLPSRNYFAIMGAASSGCDDLVKSLIKTFLVNEGDPVWIVEGLEAAPNYVKDFGALNDLLNMRPWEITLEDLAKMHFQKNTDSFVQTCMILTSFQRLGSIMLSCDVNINTPEELKERKKIVKNPDPSLNDLAIKTYKNLLKANNSKDLREECQQSNDIENVGDKNDYNDEDKVPKESAYKKFLKDSEMRYSDFFTGKSGDKSNSKPPNKYLFGADFPFELDGYAILKDSWSLLAKNIKDEFDFLAELTSYCLGYHKKIDNIDYFRRCVITYTEKLYGLCDQTFDYKMTNKVLSKVFKWNIKNVVCFPYKVDFTKIKLSNFNEQERIHMILLSAITKQGSQLTYVTKLINEYWMK